MSRSLEQFRDVSDRVAGNLRASIAEAERLQQHLAANTERMAGLAQQMNGTSSGGSSHDAERLAAAADSLSRAAGQLSELAATAGSDGAVMAAGSSTSGRRGLFGIFRR
jgi:hypothetical protein